MGDGIMSFEIAYEGKTFRVPLSQGPDFILKRMRKTRTFYEDDLLAYVHRATQGDGQIIDCGANIGNHTLFFAGVMGRQTVAIEPIRRNRDLLHLTLAVNGIDHMVKVLPVAVGDHNGDVVMESPEANNPGMFRIVNASTSGEVVRLTLLDELLPEPDLPIAAIKFDLEGFEEPALRGALGLVARFRPLIIAELSSLEAFQAFFQHLSILDYSTTAIFGATPTIVFEQSRSPGNVSDEILARLRKYERKQAKRAVSP